jgi:hypothetical protein
MTHFVGVVSVPRREQFAFRRIDFVPLDGARVLAILVFADNEVQNRIVQTRRPFDSGELERVANYLNAHFAGRTVARFTEMRLKDGTPVPICGVLYQGYFEDGPGEAPGAHKEGLPVLDPQYFGGPATPNAIPLIQLFWP